mgnify:CR=1 FL=1
MKSARSLPSSASTQERPSSTETSTSRMLQRRGGILDILDNYAFVRTSGYLPGPNDVYVPLPLLGEVHLVSSVGFDIGVVRSFGANFSLAASSLFR